MNLHIYMLSIPISGPCARPTLYCTTNPDCEVLWYIYSMKLRITCWFQDSDAVRIISALFWNLTQRELVIQYRRFWTTYLSHLQKPVVQEEVVQVEIVVLDDLTLYNGTDK